MKPPTFMLIAGEASGDLLAAELVKALRSKPGAAGSKFFGAGGPKLAAAGVDLAFDMTQHSVVGIVEVLKHLRILKQLFDQLVELAFERRPDVIVCVDFSVFNHRFARKIRWELEVRRSTHGNWRPKIVKYVSPQVWASRPGRAQSMACEFDLLLSIFPFEQAWYAEHAPGMRVEFVGHPMVDRFQIQNPKCKTQNERPLVLLLPGSRVGELKRHLPVLLTTARRMLTGADVAFRMVLPDETLSARARQQLGAADRIDVQTGGLPAALAQAAVAIASTGTVTMECAFFGVPTVTLYKTSWATYQIGKRLVKVNSLTMPNLLAGEPVFPEFIQDAATPESIARAALELLNDAARRDAIRGKLAQVIASLGGPGASARAAQAIWKTLDGGAKKPG